MTSTSKSSWTRFIRLCVRIGFVGGAALLAGTGCYDTEPIHVLVTPSPKLSPDATPCEACAYAEIEGLSPTCAEKQLACATTNNCMNIMRCILQDACFEGTTFSQAIACGTPCAVSLGAGSADDPQVQAGLAIMQCSLNSCAELCR